MVVWEQEKDGKWWVVEHEGCLRTGPFESKEKGVEWFRKHLDIELEKDNTTKGE